MTKEVRFIDLFAGIGGFRIALNNLGAKCVFSSEWDKEAQKTYEMNFGEMPAGDITKIDEKDVPDHDILCGGFPCQAFSISGKQKGFNDVRGTLFFDIVRIVKEKKPKILFLENVRNLISHDNKKTLNTILRILDEIGYNVFHEVINASEHGCVTSRKRVYFVCFRKNLGIKDFNFPKPTYQERYLSDIIDKNINEQDYVINREDIVVKKNQNQNKLKPIRIGQISKGGQGERIYSIDGHAITLSAHGGGVASKTGAYLINGNVRKLTPNECRKVMGFPEDFKINPSKSQAYQQFGNSVVIPVIQKIAAKFINII